MKVICIRLITGEEVIGKYVESGIKLADSPQIFTGDVWHIPTGAQANVVIEDPRVINMMQTQQGIGISFIPYCLGNQDVKVTINLERHALSVYAPHPDLERSYIGDTSSIQVANEAGLRAAGIKI